MTMALPTTGPDVRCECGKKLMELQAGEVITTEPEAEIIVTLPCERCRDVCRVPIRRRIVAAI